MPTYEYRCPEGHEFEKFFRTISGAPTTVSCPTCGAIAERQLSGGAGLLFKGSGFYLTDYGKNAHATKGPKPATPDGGASAGSSTSSGESKNSSDSSSKGAGGSSGSGKPSAGASGSGGSAGSGGGSSSSSGSSTGGGASGASSSGGSSSGKPGKKE